jgi:hypothetical protein
LQTKFEIARSLELGDGMLLDEAEALSEQVSKMLYTMIGKLKESKAH